MKSGLPCRFRTAEPGWPSCLPRLKALLPFGLTSAVLLWAGCAGRIGADRVSTRQAYAQVDACALATGRPNAATIEVLHRYDLDRLAAGRPDEAVRQLHAKALASGERDALFALAELSYVAADQVRRSVKPWEPRDARDYYLGSAVYAWLFLFGDGSQPPPNPFDRRFRQACDYYDYGLGLALTDRHGTNAVVRLESGPHRLPVGEIELKLDSTRFASRWQEFECFLLADRFRVRGFSARNREPGLGAPLICVRRPIEDLGIRTCSPATVFLRGPARLADTMGGNCRCALEIYPAFDASSVAIGGRTVPLEIDLTTFRGYVLNQERIWRVGWLEFLAPADRIEDQLMLSDPGKLDQIPVVFVHGTFSSPITWAEMVNTLTADPVLRQRYRVWSYVYGSGNPLAASMTDFRAALTEQVQRLDPAGTNLALRQMVIIGHSQGGLLAKTTAVSTGDRLWRQFSAVPLEDVKVSEERREELRKTVFLEPLPFVKRVVFIATPHRGSYRSGTLARRLGRRFVSLPRTVVSSSRGMLHVAAPEYTKFFQGRVPTSLDGMSPENPALVALADIPVTPPIKAHSIIPVRGNGDPREGGRDGVVSYDSAHVAYVESEYIVRTRHSCLNHPAVIEEVRRILHEHLASVDAR